MQLGAGGLRSWSCVRKSCLNTRDTTRSRQSKSLNYLASLELVGKASSQCITEDSVTPPPSSHAKHDLVGAFASPIP